jgi:hypothetical protein
VSIRFVADIAAITRDRDGMSLPVRCMMRLRRAMSGPSAATSTPLIPTGCSKKQTKAKTFDRGDARSARCLLMKAFW